MIAMWDGGDCDMKAFRVHGEYSPRGKRWFKFSKDVIAESEKDALERVYSVMGSKHGIKRRLIKIKAIKEIGVEESEDPVVKYYLSGRNE